MNKSKMELRAVLLSSGNVRLNAINELANRVRALDRVQSTAHAIAARQREMGRKVTVQTTHVSN